MKRRTLSNILSVLVVAIILGGVYFSYTWMHRPKQPSTHPPTISKSSIDGTKKTTKQKAEYTVPADHPRELSIAKLGIDANILPVGLLAGSVLDAPKTAWDVGWYNQSSLPGADSGALLIDGHVNDELSQPGVFYSIGSLKSGDEIKVERGDRQLLTYKVVTVEQKPTDQVDMAKLLASATPGKQGLNLITCGGTYNYQKKSYTDRVLVYAVLS